MHLDREKLDHVLEKALELFNIATSLIEKSDLKANVDLLKIDIERLTSALSSNDNRKISIALTFPSLDPRACDYGAILNLGLYPETDQKRAELLNAISEVYNV